MFYFTHHYHATLCSSPSRNIQNTLDTEVLKVWISHLKKIMCWPLCRPCQRNTNPHTHAHTHTSNLATVPWMETEVGQSNRGCAWGAVWHCLCPCLQGGLCQGDWHWSCTMEQEKKDVWCHPITTQAAADSTHGKCVRVHALKHRGRNNSMFGQ